MQLLYPWFLVGLLGIGVPVLIHLLELRKPQRMLFTNTAFIREVELVTVQRRKLQSLLVLLARILAVVALVLMFCQPFLPADERTGNANGVATVVVDNSYSMEAQGSGQGSLFENAVVEARKIGETMDAGTNVGLANANSLALTPTAYQNKLDKLKLNIRAPFKQVIGRVGGEGSKFGALYVISDFQKSELSAKQLNSLSRDGDVILLPLLAKAAANVYVDSLWLDDAFVRARTNAGLHLRLRNGGIVAASDCPVKVFLGNKQVAAFQITLEPGQASISVVQVQVADNELAVGRVVTEDQPVTFDNTYYFTLQPAATVQILEIGTEPIAQQLYGNEPVFTYQFQTPRRVDYGAMRRANLVLLHEVSEVSAGLREGLRGVVKRGGTVVVVPSAAVKDRIAYQDLFRDLGLGTAQWEGATGTPEPREVAMPNAAEPFFRDVFGAQNRAVTMPRVAPVLRWSRTGNDILRMRDGESYLASFTSGAGKVYVFSAPFAKEYSDFAAHALFVPVMYRMAMLSYRNEQLPAYRLTQESVNLQMPIISDANANGTGRTDEASFRFVKDSLTLIPSQRVLGQEVRLEVPAGMDKPGFYQVQQRGKVLTTLAFNQDKRESELAAYSAQELREIIGPNNPNVRVLEGGAQGTRIAQLQVERTGRPLWRYFLAAALVCLLAEALLLRFGARRGTGSKAVAAA